MALEIVIRSENDAWEWLQKAIDGQIHPDELVTLKFDGWPVLDLKFTGRDFDSSVPTRIMPPLLEAQKEINRLYSQLRYGTADTRKLTNEDREKLELNVRVKKGSSNYSTNLYDVLNESLKSAVARMDGTEIALTIIAVALIWGSNVAWKNWLDHRTKNKALDTNVRMSEEERKKMELIARASDKLPVVEGVAEGADDFRNSSLRKLELSDTFSIPDSNIRVDGALAAEITEKPREQSREIRLDGEFIIQSVTSGETHGFKVKVKRTDDGKIINVTIPDGTLKQSQVNILKNNEWAKKPIYMEINAKELRGEITTAYLVSASEISKEE